MWALEKVEKKSTWNCCNLMVMACCNQHYDEVKIKHWHKRGNVEECWGFFRVPWCLELAVVVEDVFEAVVYVAEYFVVSRMIV